METETIKHLEFIQANISRMSKCSFTIKGWAVTLITAMLAIYVTSVGEDGKGNSAYIFVGIVPTIIFWLMDSYYLLQERKFIRIYNDVAGITPNNQVQVRMFEMPLKKYTGIHYNYFIVLFSISEAPLYICMIAGLMFGYFLLL